MTDTNTLAPADAEILDAAEDFRSQYTHGGTTFDEFDALDFARAVLAKWGSPVVAGEPVAWRLKDEEASRHYGKEIYVYYGKEDFQEGVDPCDFIAGIEALTTPTPPRRRPGAVPLTPEQIKAMDRRHPAEDLCGWSYRLGIADAEAHHGIKGGQHADT